MPVCHKFFVLLQIRSIDPFFYFYLASISLFTFMNLEKILKTTILVISSQRKQPAKPWPYGMNTASAFFVQENTLLISSCHPKMRQDIPVCHIKIHTYGSQFLTAFPKTAAKPVHIQGVQYQCIPHSLAAVTAACTILAVCLYHVICSI